MWSLIFLFYSHRRIFSNLATFKTQILHVHPQNVRNTVAADVKLLILIIPLKSPPCFPTPFAADRNFNKTSSPRLPQGYCEELPCSSLSPVFYIRSSHIWSLCSGNTVTLNRMKWTSFPIARRLWEEMSPSVIAFSFQITCFHLNNHSSILIASKTPSSFADSHGFGKVHL